MPWYAWVLVIYLALDRLMTVASIGRTIDITPAFAVVSLITGGLFIWALVTLGGAV
jgi:hypothetical protein